MKALLELVILMGLLIVAIKGCVTLFQSRLRRRVRYQKPEGMLFRDILAKKALETTVAPIINIDPLEQANVFASYLRIDQAISVLEGAIELDPDRFDLWLRLLELYDMNHNGAGFDQCLSLLPDDLVFENSEVLVQLAEQRAKLTNESPVTNESFTPLTSDLSENI